jgi:hypothetical protein
MYMQPPLARTDSSQLPQAIAERITKDDALDTRLVCRHWAASLAELVTRLHIQVPAPAQAAGMQQHLSKLSNRLAFVVDMCITLPRASSEDTLQSLLPSLNLVGTPLLLPAPAGMPWSHGSDLPGVPCISSLTYT